MLLEEISTAVVPDSSIETAHLDSLMSELHKFMEMHGHAAILRLEEQRKWTEFSRSWTSIPQSFAAMRDFYRQSRESGIPPDPKIEAQLFDTCQQANDRLAPIENEYRQMARSLYIMEDTLAVRNMIIQEKYRVLRPENIAAYVSDDDNSTTEPSHISYEPLPPRPAGFRSLPLYTRSEASALSFTDSRASLLLDQSQSQPLHISTVAESHSQPPLVLVNRETQAGSPNADVICPPLASVITRPSDTEAEGSALIDAVFDDASSISSRKSSILEMAIRYSIPEDDAESQFVETNAPGLYLDSLWDRPYGPEVMRILPMEAARVDSASQSSLDSSLPFIIGRVVLDDGPHYSTFGDLDSTHKRINRWLLHKLRSSRSEVLLFHSMLPQELRATTEWTNKLMETWDKDDAAGRIYSRSSSKSTLPWY